MNIYLGVPAEKGRFEPERLKMSPKPSRNSWAKILVALSPEAHLSNVPDHTMVPAEKGRIEREVAVNDSMLFSTLDPVFVPFMFKATGCWILKLRTAGYGIQCACALLQ